MIFSRRTSLLGLLAVLLFVVPVHAQDDGYGATEFANSGSEDAQAPFLRGLLMLHSFEYVDARAAFQEALQADPDFAMAVWGEAMTHNHPIWMRQDREAALKALQKLGDTPEAQLAAAPTEREKHYLRTLHVLYQPEADSPASKETRDDRYADAVGELAAAYPDDLDAQAFHALAILGTAHEGRDFPTYMRAAAIVEAVFDENPEHPGAAHYLIHAYDDPVHAPLGLRPARVYADVAPSASHALHMPSHIFFALGMWDRGAASNVDSYEAAKQATERRGEGLNGHGFHALQWLHYARLQQGRYADARDVLATARKESDAPDVTTNYATFVDVTLPLVYLVETGSWEEVEALDLAESASSPRLSVTLAATKGMASVKQGDVAAAREHLSEAQSKMPGEDADEALRIQIHQLKALIAHAQGDADAVVTHMDAATELEEERPLNFGPPFPVKPANELYGELLLKMDRPADAQVHFETALDRYPKRARSLMGLATAAATAGDATTAEETRAALQDIWDEADEEVRSKLTALPVTSDASKTDADPTGR